jgi:hypothetical protein
MFNIPSEFQLAEQVSNLIGLTEIRETRTRLPSVRAPLQAPRPLEVGRCCDLRSWSHPVVKCLNTGRLATAGSTTTCTYQHATGRRNSHRTRTSRRYGTGQLV